MSGWQPRLFPGGPAYLVLAGWLLLIGAFTARQQGLATLSYLLAAVGIAVWLALGWRWHARNRR